MPRNFKAILAYDGSPFSGWQIQPGRTTIQGKFAGVIKRITGEQMLPQGSGRTDAGVHALAQVASFTLESPIPVANLHTALNDKLPESIRVMALEEVPLEFHARHSAKAKTYQYRVYRSAICPPFMPNYVAHVPWPLDASGMQRAASIVVGKHDFTSFTATDPEKTARDNKERFSMNDNVRTIYSSAWESRGEELIYTVRGNGFLHHMVRNLVGTMLLVGKGTNTPADVERILAAKNRSQTGPTAAANGLYLVSVEY